MKKLLTIAVSIVATVLSVVSISLLANPIVSDDRIELFPAFE